MPDANLIMQGMLLTIRKSQEHFEFSQSAWCDIALIAGHKTWACASSRVHASTCRHNWASWQMHAPSMSLWEAAMHVSWESMKEDLYIYSQMRRWTRRKVVECSRTERDIAWRALSRMTHRGGHRCWCSQGSLSHWMIQYRLIDTFERVNYTRRRWTVEKWYNANDDLILHETRKT